MRRTSTGNTSHHKKCLKEYCCEILTHYNYKIFPINLRFLHLPEYNTQYTMFYILEISPLQREILTKIPEITEIPPQYKKLSR